MKRRCTRCGAIVDDNFSFCPECGGRVESFDENALSKSEAIKTEQKAEPTEKEPSSLVEVLELINIKSAPYFDNEENLNKIESQLGVQRRIMAEKNTGAVVRTLLGLFLMIPGLILLFFLFFKNGSLTIFDSSSPFRFLAVLLVPLSSIGIGLFISGIFGIVKNKSRIKQASISADSLKSEFQRINDMNEKFIAQVLKPIIAQFVPKYIPALFAQDFQFVADAYYYVASNRAKDLGEAYTLKLEDDWRDSISASLNDIIRNQNESIGIQRKQLAAQMVSAVANVQTARNSGRIARNTRSIASSASRSARNTDTF